MHYEKRNGSINYAGYAPKSCRICMNNLEQKCILKEMSVTLEYKTNSFRERIYCNRNIDFRKPNSVQIEN